VATLGILEEKDVEPRLLIIPIRISAGK